MKKEDLLKLVADDDLELLKVKPISTGAMTADHRLVSSFKEIEEFFVKNGREPQPNHSDMHEFKLNSRLAGIRSSKLKSDSLRAIDTHQLLGKFVETVDDIYGDDDLGLLDEGEESIFKLRHVPSTMKMPDKIASRKPCEDFEKFEPLFVTCHAELSAGMREMRAFTGEQQIKPGHFFVLHGVVCYVAEVGEKEVKNKKVNARLRVIFDNGTESNMLLRSLATELYKDPSGRRILDGHDKALEELELIKSDDQSTGYVYVLKSRSELPEVKKIANLFKIGFATTSVEDRIKNAAKEPTYLMAPVKIVSAFQCYNLNPQKFENLLHTFFGKHCLELKVTDGQGKLHVPREWFIAPIASIELAIQLLINGEIIHYHYDGDLEQVVLKD
ncbi:MAG: GIY-YIG nuclease family protein [Polaromonas sp.]|uniref:GIY-YIG nuclease family protein n=1 Tax=Polaromonas sp. TaxID=1869339 RepID=UPI0024881824|nr:GIY-YIG nuclease family protein [Polaromonas sp.]MDI1238655.1 GIY-YIG nuclease family protein [Polaromonas sp.]